MISITIYWIPPTEQLLYALCQLTLGNPYKAGLSYAHFKKWGNGHKQMLRRTKGLTQVNAWAWPLRYEQSKYKSHASL